MVTDVSWVVERRIAWQPEAHLPPAPRGRSVVQSSVHEVGALAHPDEAEAGSRAGGGGGGSAVGHRERERRGIAVVDLDGHSRAGRMDTGVGE
jgi:hypothetical protein